MELREVTYTAVVIRILASILFGGIIGLERGMKNRPAGLRTYMLVCMGSCLIMLTNQYMFQCTLTGDPGRFGAQVVSGIGFLGAGTIVVTKHNQIKGLTTAAGLWAAAGVGLALGVGFYEGAVVSGVSIYVILSILQRWDNKVRNKTRFIEIYVEIAEGTNLSTFIHTLRELDFEIRNIQLERESGIEEGTHTLTATLKAPKRFDHVQLSEKIRKIDGVVYLEEL